MMKSLTPFSLLLLLLGTVGIVAFILISAPLWPALLVAALLAYLLNPVVNLLEKRLGGRRNLAVILIYTVSILILAGFVSAVGALIVGRVPAWSLELGDALIEMEQWLERPFILLGFTIEPQALLNYAQQIGASGVAAIPAVPGGLLGGIADNLLWSLVILISLYYLMRDGRDIAPSLVRLLPPAYQAETNALLADIDNVWRVFLRVQLLIFIILGVLLVLSTTLLLWFFRRGWLPLSPVGLVILLVLVYAAIQQIDNLWLRPQYMGHALKLHPGVVVVALLAALVLTGVLGALVIVPTLATLKILAEFFYDRWLPKIAEPRPGPPRSSPPTHPNKPAATAPDHHLYTEEHTAMIKTWHTESVEAVLTALTSDPDNGLTDAQAQERLQQHGRNELIERGGKHPLRLLWEQASSTMVLILIGAVVISALLGKVTEAVAIGAIVVLFVILGFVQEYRAEQAMAALKKMSVPLVRVRRGARCKSCRHKSWCPATSSCWRPATPCRPTCA